jgi:hypothetical protein
MIVKVGAEISDLEKKMDQAKKSVRSLKEVGKDLKEAGSAMTVGITAPVLGLVGAALLAASKTDAKTKEVMDRMTGRIDSTMAHLGSAITPVFEKVVDKGVIPMLDGLNQLIDAYESLPTPVQDFIAVLVILLAALGPVLLVVGQVLTTAAALAPVITALGGVLGGVALGPVALLVAALIGLVAAFIWLYDNVAWFRKAVNDNIQGFVTDVKIAMDVVCGVLNILAALLNGDLTGAVRAWAGMWKNVWNDIKSFMNNIGIAEGVEKIVNGVINTLNGFIKAYNELPDWAQPFGDIGSLPNVKIQEGGASGGGCFTAGTKVTMADGTPRPIEQIMPGDQVQSYDPDTLKPCLGVVVAKYTHPSREQLQITFTDGRRVTTTGEHPFHAVYTLSNERIHEYFIPAGELLPGDTALAHIDGIPVPAEVATVQVVRENTVVYNFNVTPHHTYIAEGCMVHNVKARASGGDVEAGVPYLVGERGPELRVFNRGGSIVPNNQLAGETHVHVYLDSREITNLIGNRLVKQISRDTGVRY